MNDPALQFTVYETDETLDSEGDITALMDHVTAWHKSHPHLGRYEVYEDELTLSGRRPMTPAEKTDEMNRLARVATEEAAKEAEAAEKERLRKEAETERLAKAAAAKVEADKVWQAAHERYENGVVQPQDVTLYASQARYVIPRKVSGHDITVTIGPDVYEKSKRKGWFVQKVYGSFNGRGLDHDGTWSKYGEAFETAEEAFEALMAAPTC